MEPRAIFLLDGVGAFLSAVALGVVLPAFPALFGMPTPILRLLAVGAVCLSVYSLTCLIRGPLRHRGWLAGTVAANLIYVGISAAAVLRYLEVLTPWDLLYFSGEIVVILSLTHLEWRILLNRALWS